MGLCGVEGCWMGWSSIGVFRYRRFVRIVFKAIQSLVCYWLLIGYVNLGQVEFEGVETLDEMIIWIIFILSSCVKLMLSVVNGQLRWPIDRMSDLSLFSFTDNQVIFLQIIGLPVK